VKLIGSFIPELLSPLSDSTRQAYESYLFEWLQHLLISWHWCSMLSATYDKGTLAVEKMLKGNNWATLDSEYWGKGEMANSDILL
jgi:hypothetical protein